MEISLLSPNSLRIKSKHAALVVDPNSTLGIKTSAESVLLLNKTNKYSMSKIEGARLLIKGAGEYEVEGVRISAFEEALDISYKLEMDNLEVLLTKTSTLKKLQEIIKESQIIILNADTVIDESLIVEFSANVVILYGEKMNEIASNLAEKNTPVNKYQVTREKLPEEMQTILLSQ